MNAVFRSRCQLHLSKIDEFAAYCETQGFRRVAVKGGYEILRMVAMKGEPVIVHAKSGSKEHATTWGMSERMYLKWQRSKRAAREAKS
ncbi:MULTISPECIES: hypothetical protein [unclassified Rhodanobacter]|uniref:hypothetical protein n=1 Tax=unclassified Rhodanobacter TaxID=2621553 RepID=UPI001BDE57AA|nr:MULTISPECIES: hypothetical protein [unclassified Rhodanobacter]MBT2142724.1 hypothetical protein [Rhodanobacter sp. LX-99]MBT2148203.1 hypothetical protein [Rhodanobacter sp. LX-100]